MCQRWVRQETRHCDLPQSRAFSSEVETGSREENASKQKDRAPFRFNRNGKGSGEPRIRKAASAPTMNLIGTSATNRLTGSKEPENEGWKIFDRNARCLRDRPLGHWRGRRAAGGATRRLRDRREIHPEIAGWRGNDRAISEQGNGRLEMAVLGAPAGHIHAA